MKNTDKYNNLVQSIKDDEEKEKEQNPFDATLEQLKKALALLQKLLEAIMEAKESSVTTQKGLAAATLSAENAITGICGAIVKAQQTPVRTRLDDESLKQLQDIHTQWLEEERQKLLDHHRQQEDSWQKHSQRLTNIVKNNEGVWLSSKLFLTIPLVNHNDCNGNSVLCVLQVDCMTMNSHGFSATSRTLFQVKNCPLLFNGQFFVELLLLDSLNQVAYGLRSLGTALLQLGIKVFV